MALFRNLPRREKLIPERIIPPGASLRQIVLSGATGRVRHKQVPADHPVLLAFQDVQNARKLKSGAATVERQAWNRLMRYLLQLPPLPPV
jgi:hypothetical protein